VWRHQSGAMDCGKGRYLRAFIGGRTNSDASRKGHQGRKGFQLEKIYFLFATFALLSVQIAQFRKDFTVQFEQKVTKVTKAFWPRAILFSIPLRLLRCLLFKSSL
jgi:hypothetical protein